MVNKRKKAIALFALALILILAFSLTALYALKDDLTSTQYEITPQNLPCELNGIKIALIADLHNTRFGEAQEELISATLQEDPDIVVLCGDILDSTNQDITAIEELLKGISHLPVFSVYGNHENRVSIFDRGDLANLYKSYGVTLLVDKSETLNINDAEICISGMDDPAFWGRGDLEFVQNNPPDVTPSKDAFNILLCHRANVYPAINDLGFDLVLAGHLHGGHVRIPFVGGLISPNRELFPKYTSGVHYEADSVMVVSRGLGNPTDFPRLFNSPELVFITLLSK